MGGSLLAFFGNIKGFLPIELLGTFPLSGMLVFLRGSPWVGPSLPAFFGNVFFPLGLLGWVVHEGMEVQGPPRVWGQLPLTLPTEFPVFPWGWERSCARARSGGGNPARRGSSGSDRARSFPTWRFGDPTGRGRREGRGLRGFPGAAFEVSASDLVWGWVEAPLAGMDHGIVPE